MGNMGAPWDWRRNKDRRDRHDDRRDDRRREHKDEHKDRRDRNHR